MERANAKRRRKQQLNACLKRKGQPTGCLNDDKLEAFARNEIGRALNPMLDELPGGSKLALERLTVKDMRFKSRQMNRAWRASQLGTSETSSNSSWTSAVFVIARCSQPIPANSLPNVGLPFR